MPPAQYEVVLEPDAVADLLANLATFGFNGRAFGQRQSFVELGAEQFDRAVTIVDEPLTGPGEPAPGLSFDVEGTPRSTLSLVRAGTTTAVTHDRRSAAEVGAASTGHAAPSSRTWGPIASHMRLDSAPSGDVGPTAESARPLVAKVERGLFITDFWYTRVLDQKSLVVTGVTRNGVWLIEDGEVTTAVSNMRFTQSYPEALAPGAVRGIGPSLIARLRGHVRDPAAGPLARRPIHGPGTAVGDLDDHRQRHHLRPPPCLARPVLAPRSRTPPGRLIMELRQQLHDQRNWARERAGWAKAV